MRIGKIEHMRCDEIEAHTYVVIPDGWSKDDFSARVRAARDAYQTMIDTIPPDEPPRPDHYPNLVKLDPSVTVGELLKERQEKQAAWTAWFEEREKARRSFGEHLKDHGLVLVQDYEDHEFIPINWGHRHGQKIHYDGIPFSWSSEEED